MHVVHASECSRVVFVSTERADCLMFDVVRFWFDGREDWRMVSSEGTQKSVVELVLRVR